MKAITIIVFLAVGSLFADLVAQEHILSFIKKCESIESVEMDAIRNPKENNVTLLAIRFSDNDDLLNELLAAFKADEPNANEIIERKVDGKMMPSMITFDEVCFSVKIAKETKTVSLTQMNGDKIKSKIAAERRKHIH
ncbi:MAG: hypothetical protein LBH04_06855 [Tannerellaceae bacterium]|jgi:hypothetical protein|nr:hypothetical protein [Tannerellaceae bacterium]